MLGNTKYIIKKGDTVKFSGVAFDSVCSAEDYLKDYIRSFKLIGVVDGGERLIKTDIIMSKFDIVPVCNNYNEGEKVFEHCS